MMQEQGWSADEMMTVSAARTLKNSDSCFVGIGIPSTAAILAKATHAPELVLIYESGTIDTNPAKLPLSIGIAYYGQSWAETLRMRSENLKDAQI